MVSLTKHLHRCAKLLPAITQVAGLRHRDCLIFLVLLANLPCHVTSKNRASQRVQLNQEFF